MKFVSILNVLSVNLSLGMKHKEDVKRLLSEKRKKWLKENPDKHPWRKSSKFKSVPCEHFKSFLKEKGFKFLEEFIPLEGRYFSLDVAFPEKMIAIEINGNQHYQSDGKLKPYYQQRHDLLELNGWKVLEVHFSLCYNKEYIESLISTISQIKPVNDFDYAVWESGRSVGVPSRNLALEERCDMQFHHRPLDKFQYEFFLTKNKKKTSKCAECGTKISRQSTHCRSCAAKRQPKTQLPEKETLQKLIFEEPLSKLGPKFGLTDNGLKKRCRELGLIIPNNSYRRKKHIEKLNAELIDFN